MDTLSTLDAEFLHMEDGISHMHIAGLSVFEGPPPDEGDLEKLLRSKLHLIPRYRQRVRTVPFELGRPVWVDDPHFNLGYHLRRTALARPGDDATLCALMARLMGQPLDRDRPLWETWTVEGLPDDRWAMIFKVHHCMVDGIAGVGLLGALLDIDPHAELPDEQPWEPAPAPSGAAMVLGAWSGLAANVTEQVCRLPGLVMHPAETLESVSHTASGVLGFSRSLSATPPLTIEGHIGPHRSWAHSSASIADVKAIRTAFGGTLNDVVLAAVTKGYRDFLLHRGDVPQEARLRTLIPVSQRGADAHGTPDNRVSALLFELPIHLEDPVERLLAVHEQMQSLKESHIAEAADWVTHAGDLAPPMIVGTATRLIVRALHDLPQRSINTVATNVPGPQFPIYCLGREMLEYRPYVPISHGVRVATAILSYNGRLSFGVTGDYDTAPDVALLADAIAAGVTELRELAGAP